LGARALDFAAPPDILFTIGFEGAYSLDLSCIVQLHTYDMLVGCVNLMVTMCYLPWNWDG
jgi:hypothetical protein